MAHRVQHVSSTPKPCSHGFLHLNPVVAEFPERPGSFTFTSARWYAGGELPAPQELNDSGVRRSNQRLSTYLRVKDLGFKATCLDGVVVGA